MSEFPVKENYKTPQSRAHLETLEKSGIRSEFPLVIKKEKGPYLYDIDGNKYADFFLHDGSVIAGHGHPTLTQFIKNGISSGMSSGMTGKFMARLLRIFREMIDFQYIGFYNHLNNAVLSLLHSLKPVLVGVSSDYLLKIVEVFSHSVSVEKMKEGVRYDLILFEPIDFDGSLETIDLKNYSSKKFCCVENRTGFRLKFGFLTDLKKTDFLISANNIANGLDSAVILSNEEVSGEALPIYRSVAILETIKFYKRKINYSAFNMDVNEKTLIIHKNIFRLNRKIKMESLLPDGIFLNGDIGFLCLEHSLFDLERLKKAILS